MFSSRQGRKRVILSWTAEHFTTLVSKHGRCLFHHASILAVYSFKNTSLYLQGSHQKTLDDFEILRADVDLIPYNWLLYQLLVSAKGHEVQLQHSNIKQQILPNCNLQMRGVFFSPCLKSASSTREERKKREKTLTQSKRGAFNYLHSHKCYRCNHLDDWFHRSTFSVTCLSSDTPQRSTFLEEEIRKSQIAAAIIIALWSINVEMRYL